MEETKQDLPEDKTPEETLTDTDKEVIEKFLEEPLEKEEEKEEKPEEKPEEEEKAPEEPEEKEEEKPVEEIVEEVRKDEREKVKQEILEAVGISDAGKKEVEESEFKFAWEERGEDKPASWEEQSKETIRLYKHIEDQEKAKETVKREELAVDVEKRNKAVNAEWDSQIAWLVETGELPAVAPEIAKKRSEGKPLTIKEKEDAGIKAQSEIFTTMYQLDQETGGKGPTDVIHIYNRYIKPKNKKPAGAKAPVSGGRTPMETSDKDNMTYEELHSTTFEEIAGI